MSDCEQLNLVIRQGKTFSKVLRWGQPHLTYAAISGITKAAPCVVTATAHGLADGWPFKIANVLGMTQVNSINRPKWGGNYQASVVAANTVELNDVDALGFDTYTSGSGTLSYHTPYDLTGFTGRMQIRADATATAILLELTTANGGIVLDNTNHTITLNITAVATAAIDWLTAVFDLELIDSLGTVFSVAGGAINVYQEVTR